MQGQRIDHRGYRCLFIFGVLLTCPEPIKFDLVCGLMTAADFDKKPFLSVDFSTSCVTVRYDIKVL